MLPSQCITGPVFNLVIHIGPVYLYNNIYNLFFCRLEAEVALYDLSKGLLRSEVPSIRPSV